MVLCDNVRTCSNSNGYSNGQHLYVYIRNIRNHLFMYVYKIIDSYMREFIKANLTFGPFQHNYCLILENMTKEPN